MMTVSETGALESSGPGGRLHWVEHQSGTWSAQGTGGRFDVYPKADGQYTAQWQQHGTGISRDLGTFNTLGAAWAACARHQHSESSSKAAAEGEGTPTCGCQRQTEAVALAVVGAREKNEGDLDVTEPEVFQAIRFLASQNSAHVAFIPNVIRVVVQSTPGSKMNAVYVNQTKRMLLKMEKEGKIDLLSDDGFGRITQTDKSLSIKTKDDRYLAYTKFRHHGANEAASEPVPVIHEANDVGAFATNDRNVKAIAKGQSLGKANTPRAVYDMLHVQLAKESQEVFLVLPLDLHGQPLSPPVEVARGQRDRVSVSISDVLRPVITTNARGFIVVHNHPSGHAKPSPKDKELTEAIRKSTKTALSDVDFLDHIIIACSGKSGEFYSFTENKLTTVRG
jgi:hypothetical protein